MVTAVINFLQRPRPRQRIGNKALMPPRRRAYLSRTQLCLRRLRHKDLRRRRNEAAAHLRAAAELLATRGPRRSLRIEWLGYNAPSLTAGQAPWYRLVLFGEEDYDQQGFPPDGYRIVVGDNGDAVTDTDH